MFDDFEMGIPAFVRAFSPYMTQYNYNYNYTITVSNQEYVITAYEYVSISKNCTQKVVRIKNIAAAEFGVGNAHSHKATGLRRRKAFAKSRWPRTQHDA